MVNIKKEITVDIKIDLDEEGMKKLIIDEIARQDASIKVENIRFVQKRSPTQLAVEIDATLHGEGVTKKPVAAKAEEPEESVKEESEPAVETPKREKLSFKKEEPKAEESEEAELIEEVLEEPVKPASVKRTAKSLFG